MLHHSLVKNKQVVSSMWIAQSVWRGGGGSAGQRRGALLDVGWCTSFGKVCPATAFCPCWALAGYFIECVCVCLCVFARLLFCAHSPMHVCVCMSECVCCCVCVYVCECLFVCVCVFTGQLLCVHIPMYVKECVCLCVCLYGCFCLHTSPYMCVVVCVSVSFCLCVCEC